MVRIMIPVVVLQDLLIMAFLVFCLWGITPLGLQAQTHPHWHYGGAENPSRWGDLSPDYHLCALGHNQSPIDFESVPVNSSLPPLKVRYRPGSLHLINNGHTIQVQGMPDSALWWNGDRYELIQFHFHTPSEHTMLGKASAMELHFVHRNAQGKIAVVGLLINVGEENPVFGKIWPYFPAKKEEKNIDFLRIHPAALFPADRSYYHYQGSLTTPPCAEGVEWFVLEQAITASAEQIEVFTQQYPYNARPVQPQNGRLVEHTQK